MLGNVAEFCSDWYQEDAYSIYPEGLIVDPKGPDSGSERVIRGGSFLNGAGALRCATRDYTRTEAWLKTDLRSQKIWCFPSAFSGFRVVCEFTTKPKAVTCIGMAAISLGQLKR
jgi:formylglycine-generating enzyme required for sulfatase activity